MRARIVIESADWPAPGDDIELTAAELAADGELLTETRALLRVVPVGLFARARDDDRQGPVVRLYIEATEEK